MKKLYFVMALLIVATMILAACGTSPSNTVESPGWTYFGGVSIKFTNTVYANDILVEFGGFIRPHAIEFIVESPVSVYAETDVTLYDIEGIKIDTNEKLEIGKIYRLILEKNQSLNITPADTKIVYTMYKKIK